MIMQKRNPELVDILRTDFQHRNESNFAWKSAVSAFQAIPGLRAFWPMSSVDYQNPAARDLAGGGYHLTNNNSANFGYNNLAPLCSTNGTNQYLSRADGGGWADIRGTETFIVTAQLGLTIGGWFYIDSHDSDWEFLIGKSGNAAGTRGYFLDNGNAPNYVARFIVSVDGTAETILPMEQLTVGAWEFVVGRFYPSTSLDGWVSGTSYTLGAAIPASVFNNAQDFTIAARAGPLHYCDMKSSLCFLSNCLVSDAIIFSLFQQTRAMFGV